MDTGLQLKGCLFFFAFTLRIEQGPDVGFIGNFFDWMILKMGLYFMTFLQLLSESWIFVFYGVNGRWSLWLEKTRLWFLDVRYKVCINSETTFIRLSRVFFSWYKHKVTNMVSLRDCLPLGIFNLSFRKKLSLFELSLFEFCKPPW